jgi:uncharacterized cupredoxin-like copper-binding protein
MPPTTRILAMLVASALTLTACGGDEATVRAPGPDVTVTLDDYLVRPQRLEVPKGERLNLTVVNRGRLGHTFRIRGRTKNVLAFTTLEPGERRSRAIRLGAGRYTMYCVLANHEELGMYGSLVVR